MDQVAPDFKVKARTTSETVTFSFAKLVRAKAGRTWYIGGDTFAPNVWLTMTVPWSDFAGSFFADHAEREEKDGTAFVPGGLKVGDQAAKTAVQALNRLTPLPEGATGTLNRCNAGITHMSMLVLDYDKGAPFDDVVDVLSGLGLEFVAYTSFSHGKSLTTLSKRQLVTFNDGENTLSADVVRRYLTEHERYDAEIVATAEIGEEHQDAGGVLWVDVQHAPMDKFRVVVPLAEPFACLGDGDAAQRWRTHYAAFGEMIGFSFDSACGKLCQPFYFPSRRPNSPQPRIVRGRGSFLDFDDWSEEMAAAGKRAAKRDAAQPSKRAATKPPKTSPNADAPPLRPVPDAARSAHNAVLSVVPFNTKGLPIAQLLADYADSLVTAKTERGGVVTKVQLLCPFADEHTQVRGRDVRGGAWAKNADTSETYGIVRCNHEHCKDRKTEDFLSAWIEQRVLDAATIPLRRQQAPRTFADVRALKQRFSSSLSRPLRRFPR